jgi:hypothetical protein
MREERPARCCNGIPLRADLHRLFDQGHDDYAWMRVEVSPRLRLDYQNGHSYYPLHGLCCRCLHLRMKYPAPIFSGGTTTRSIEPPRSVSQPMTDSFSQGAR